MTKLAIARVFLAAALLLPSWVRAADGSTSTRSPNGIKVGAARLHPYFDLEGRYDSAAGFVVGAQLADEFVVHARPGFRLDLQTPSTLVDFDGNLDYLWYTGLLNPGLRFASRFQGGVGLNTDFNREGAVGFQVSDTLSRSDRTANPVIGVGVLSLFNQVRAGIPIRPGGRALEVTPSFAYAFEFFEPFSSIALAQCTPGDFTCDPGVVGQMNYTNMTFGLNGRWKFLPKTAIVLDSSYDWRSYSTAANNRPAQLLKASLGLAGLVSPKIAVVAKVGYGQDFLGSGAQTVLAHAELAYLLNEMSTLKIGYLRTLDPVPVFGVVGDDRGYAEARFLLGGKLALRAGAMFDYLSYYSGAGRNDTLLTLNAGPDFQVASWFILGAGYMLSTRASNISLAGLNFNRHEAFARVTLTY